MNAQHGDLRRAREGSHSTSDRAIRLAQTVGITVTHAAIALLDDPQAKWAPILRSLVRHARGTLLHPHHRDADPDPRRYYLLATTSRALPYDRARGYCPIEIASHWVSDVRASSDLDEVRLIWTLREPHAGVACHSALIEYTP